MNVIKTPVFNGYKVQSKKGALNENILLKNEQVVNQSLQAHRKVCALRFELKLPYGSNKSTVLISRFFDALRGRLKNDVKRKSVKWKKNVNTELDYIWVKEQSKNQGWHFHVVILLNHDVYNGFGFFDVYKEYLYSFIAKSWASALDIELGEVKGLVHVPRNPIYRLDNNSPDLSFDIEDLLYRLSYFAKLYTKPYGTDRGGRYFGTSKLKNKEPVFTDSWYG